MSWPLAQALGFGISAVGHVGRERNRDEHKDDDPDEAGAVGICHETHKVQNEGDDP